MESLQRPAAAPEAGDRRERLLPAAILGNGSLLVTLSARGEIERLFWPRVDGGQHLGELRLGISFADDTRWLDETPFGWEQEYLGETTILRTVARGEGLEIELVDLVTPDEPLLVRRVRGEAEGARLVVSCRPHLDEAGNYDAAYVDEDAQALVFYRRNVALAVFARGGTGRLEAGLELEVRSVDGAHDGPSPGDLVAHCAPVEGVLTLPLGGEVEIVVSFGSSPVEAIDRGRQACDEGFATLAKRRRSHDGERLSAATRQVALVEGLESLHGRSLFVLEQLTDRVSGATIAAPEFDPRFAYSGGYGFVWPRDLAFIVLGFLAAGRDDLTVPALHWLARHQAPEGLWLQRYWTDGALAPSWSLHQIDETGAVLFAFEAAWRELRDTDLDHDLWPSARAAAELLCRFLDPESGLPLPSVDLWEQHDGQHSYSAAAIYGGLSAAAAMADRHEPELASRYRTAAAGVRTGIERHLWSEQHGHYLRSGVVGRRDELGQPLVLLFDRGLRYPNRAVRSSDPLDPRLDSSLLGLAWPFRAVDPGSPRMRATVAALERELLQPGGGVLRYEGDDYAGGNPWIISTLWLGLYKRQIGDEAGWRRCVDYAIAHQTTLGLLPEQVGPDGAPAWVLPLAWSHAMLLLAAGHELSLVRDPAV